MQYFEHVHICSNIVHCLVAKYLNNSCVLLSNNFEIHYVELAAVDISCHCSLVMGMNNTSILFGVRTFFSTKHFSSIFFRELWAQKINLEKCSTHALACFSTKIRLINGERKLLFSALCRLAYKLRAWLSTGFVVNLNIYNLLTFGSQYI